MTPSAIQSRTAALHSTKAFVLLAGAYWLGAVPLAGLALLALAALMWVAGLAYVASAYRTRGAPPQGPSNRAPAS